MSRTLVVHISDARFERIRAQGYGLARNESPFSPPNNSGYGPDVWYHVLEADSGPCLNCGNVLRTSVVAETPAELEIVKEHLQSGPFPVIKMDRCFVELDMDALCWLNKQMEFIATQSDYQAVDLQIRRVPMPERFVREQPESVTFPSLSKNLVDSTTEVGEG